MCPKVEKIINLRTIEMAGPDTTDRQTPVFVVEHGPTNWTDVTTNRHKHYLMYEEEE